MNRQMTRLFLIAGVAAASACMPDFGTFDGGAPPDAGDLDGGVDGGEVDGGEVDGGEVDGGAVDGGAVDGGEADGGEADGGDVDGGAVDGGAVDGGAVDGGAVDGGGVDGGEVDGGGEVDAGPIDCRVPDILSSSDWACLSDPGSTGITDCLPASAGAVVDIETSCQDTFLLSAFGIVHRLSADGTYSRWSTCDGVTNAPLQFTDLEVRGDTAIAFERGNVGYCVLNADVCDCVANPGVPVHDLRFIDDDSLLGIVATVLVESPIGTVDSPSLRGLGSGARFAIPFQDADGYRVAVVRDDGTIDCFRNTTGSAFDVSSNCPADNNHGAGTLLDIGTRENGVQPLRLLDVTNGLDAVGEFRPFPNSTPFANVHTTLSPYFEATAFGAFGSLVSPTRRVALGGPGGTVLTSSADQLHVVAPLLPTNRAELGAVYKIVHAPGSDSHWALAEFGIWEVVNGDVINAVFHELNFNNIPGAGGVRPAGVPTAGTEFLVGGQRRFALAFEDGQVLLINIDLANVNNRIFRSLTPVSGSFADHLLVLTGTTNLSLLAFTVDAEVHRLSWPDDGTDALVQTFQRLNGYPTVDPSASGFQLTVRDALRFPGVASRASVWITRRGSGDEFPTRRVTLIAGANDDINFSQTSPNNIIMAREDGAPFRFKFLEKAIVGFAGLAWVTASGDTIVGAIETDQVLQSNQSRRRALPLFSGAGADSSGVALDRNGCVTVFDSGQAQGYNHVFQGNSDSDAPTTGFPLDAALQDAVDLGSGVGLGVGIGGLFRLTYPTSCTLNDVPSIETKTGTPARTITAVKWRTENEVIVADDVGRVWVIHLE